METIIEAILRRILRGLLQGTLILLASLNFACSSASRVADAPVESAPPAVLAEEDAQIKAILDATPSPEEDAQTKKLEEAYLKGMAEGAQLAQDEAVRQIMLDQARTHIVNYEEFGVCLEIFKAGNDSFPNEKTALRCEIAMEKKKKADIWLAEFERKQRTGEIVITTKEEGAK